MSKKKTKEFSIWIHRTDTFITTIGADSLEEALQIARTKTIDELAELSSDLIDSEHEITAVMIS